MPDWRDFLGGAAGAATRGFDPSGLSQFGIAELIDRLGKESPPPAAPAVDLATPSLEPVTATRTPSLTPETQLGLAESWQQIYQGLLKAQPHPNDPEFADDPALYQQEKELWMQQLAQAMENLEKSQQMELGILELPDGTIIDTRDPNVARDPVLAEQAAAFWAEQDRKIRTDYTNMLNELDLAEYDTVTAQTNAQNANLSKTFQNQLDRVNAELDIGKANQNTAIQRVSRQLSGMQESRSRANQIDEQLQRASGWATQAPGKTEYGAGDFGSIVAGLAKLAGVDPTQALLKFSGTRTVDPAGLLAQQDAALGVGGPLPEIPDINVSPFMIPNLPAYAEPPTAPQLRRPEVPITPPRAAAVAPAAPYVPGVPQRHPLEGVDEQDLLALQSVWESY